MTGSRADQRILVQLNAAVFERVIVFFAFSMKELLHLCSIHARNNVPRLLFSCDGQKNTFKDYLLVLGQNLETWNAIDDRKDDI
jgi:hypothetical protein